MIEAEMQNKVPKFENREDILTSNVFDLLEIIDYKYLLDILGNSEAIYDGKYTKLASKFEKKKIESVKLWKRFKEYGEPDIYITLDDDTSFIIEVKYFGGEHNKKEKNEEEDNSNKYKETGQLKKYLKITEGNEDNFIVYLTTSYMSLKELSDDSKECLESIYHLHWKDFNKYLKEEGKKPNGRCEKKVIDKVTTYLDFKGFEHWSGFKYDYVDINPNNIRRFYNGK